MSIGDSVEACLQTADVWLAEIEALTFTNAPDIPESEMLHRIEAGFENIDEVGKRLDYEEIVSFIREIRHLLKQARCGLVPVNEQFRKVILATAEQIRIYLQKRPFQNKEARPIQMALMESVHQMVATNTTGAPAPRGRYSKKLQSWRIVFRPDPDFLRQSENLFRLFRDLKRLGLCRIQASDSNVPWLQELDAEVCYLSWTIRLLGTCGELDIRSAFRFAAARSTLSITSTPETSRIGKPLKTVDPLPSVQDIPTAFLKPVELFTPAR